MKNDYYFETMFQIICTGHWITDGVARELKEFEISEPQYNVLKVLENRNGTPVTVQEITSQMVQRSSNVTRIIDKLLTRKLVERRECPSNRRKMDISITKNGEKLLKSLDKKVYAFHKPLMNNLNHKESKILTELIKKYKGEKNE